MCCLAFLRSSFFFFFNDTATTEIYTLSLHDALPICTRRQRTIAAMKRRPRVVLARPPRLAPADRKSTRLNSSHRCISYAVFCLKKKKHKNAHNYMKKKEKKNKTTRQ